MSIVRHGYNEDFLGEGIKVPLPTLGLEHDADILKNASFKDNQIVDYVHYSVVMSKSKKQAFFSF